MIGGIPMNKIEKQTENVNIKMTPSFKKKLEETATMNGLKVGPYIKMLISKNFRTCYLVKKK